MNIFKLNNDTIICIISRSDLAERNMKISELAQGTLKGKKLFKEIIKHVKTHCNYSFKTFNFVIEAQPIDDDKILIAIHEK